MSGLPLAPGIKGYTAWRKALWADDQLRELFTSNENHNRVDHRVVAENMALFGENGRGIFVAADTVAEMIGCSRNTVKRARARLVELGWFTAQTGKRGGKTCRVDVLDISLPCEPAVPSWPPLTAAPVQYKDGIDPWAELMPGNRPTTTAPDGAPAPDREPSAQVAS
jgi:hypothetical protein